jgi:hypothetical protein
VGVRVKNKVFKKNHTNAYRNGEKITQEKRIIKYINGSPECPPCPERTAQGCEMRRGALR